MALVDAICVRDSAGAPPCGDSESGALTEAFALAGAAARGAGAGTGRGAATGLGAGVAATSAGSPFTASVRILRGSSPTSVPLGTSPGRGAGATLATGGGLGFWLSGGKTVRGLALTSTGASSRGTIFSAPAVVIRSGTFATLSPGEAGTILVGAVSALM